MKYKKTISPSVGPKFWNTSPIPNQPIGVIGTAFKHSASENRALVPGKPIQFGLVLAGSGATGAAGARFMLLRWLVQLKQEAQAAVHSRIP